MSDWTALLIMVAVALLAACLIVFRAGRVARKRKRQAAAICYRRMRDRSDACEFLLVRTKNGRRWIFPKGRIERDETPAAAAAREAHEEAGVEGNAEEALCEFRYGGEVIVPWLFAVTATGSNGSGERTWNWFGPREARAALRENRPKKEARPLLRALSAAENRIDGTDPDAH